MTENLSRDSEKHSSRTDGKANNSLRRCPLPTFMTAVSLSNTDMVISDEWEKWTLLYKEKESHQVECSFGLTILGMARWTIWLIRFNVCMRRNALPRKAFLRGLQKRVQRYWRDFHAQCHTNTMGLRREVAAIIFQKVWRCYAKHTDYTMASWSCNQIQAAVFRLIAKKLANRRNDAVVCLFKYLWGGWTEFEGMITPTFDAGVLFQVLICLKKIGVRLRSHWKGKLCFCNILPLLTFRELGMSISVSHTWSYGAFCCYYSVSRPRLGWQKTRRQVLRWLFC